MIRLGGFFWHYLGCHSQGCLRGISTVASFVVLAESIRLIHTCGCPFMGVLCGWVGVSGVAQGYLFLGTPFLPLVFPWAWVCCVFFSASVSVCGGFSWFCVCVFCGVCWVGRVLRCPPHSLSPPFPQTCPPLIVSGDRNNVPSQILSNLACK